MLWTGIRSAEHYYAVFRSGSIFEKLLAFEFYSILSLLGRPVMSFVIAVAVLRIEAVLLGGILRLLRQPLRHRQPESIVSYTSLPVVLHHALGLGFLVAKDVWRLDLENPLGLSVAWILSEATTPTWLYAVASDLGVLGLWHLWLLALRASTVTQAWTVRAALAYLAPVWIAHWSAWAVLGSIFFTILEQREATFNAL